VGKPWKARENNGFAKERLTACQSREAVSTEYYFKELCEARLEHLKLFF